MDPVDPKIIQMHRKLSRVRGGGGVRVTNRPDGITISVAPAKRVRPPEPAEGAKRVTLEIVGNCTRRGLYTAKLGVRNTTKVNQNAAGFLDSDALYDMTAVENVIFSNDEEDGLNVAHRLPSGTMVIGFFWEATEDGTPMYSGIPKSLLPCPS